MTDVAEAAGVSLKTVSRVVNGEPLVAPNTAEGVREAIARLGYRRNEIARTLRQGRVTRTLGLVIEDVANPFYSAITRGVEEETRARGLLVIAGSSDEDPERERALVQLLCERRVDGKGEVHPGARRNHGQPAQLDVGVQVRGRVGVRLARQCRHVASVPPIASIVSIDVRAPTVEKSAPLVPPVIHRLWATRPVGNRPHRHA